MEETYTYIVYVCMCQERVVSCTYHLDDLFGKRLKGFWRHIFLALLEWAKDSVLSLTQARAYTSNHSSRIQKLDRAFVPFLLLSSPMKFKNTDETEVLLVTIYIRVIFRETREKGREKKGWQETNTVKEEMNAESGWKMKKRKRRNEQKREIGAYRRTDGRTDAIVPWMKCDLDDRRQKPSAFTADGLAGRRKIPRRAREKCKPSTSTTKKIDARTVQKRGGKGAGICDIYCALPRLKYATLQFPK